jgi:hypothetical protein
MLKGKTLFLIAILSWVSTSEALAAYCSVVRSSPIVNDWKQTIGSVSSGCFEPRDPNLHEYWRRDSEYWIRGYVPHFQGHAIKRGWVWASSIDCRLTCYTALGRR